ncbi:Homoserine/homoserine lactone efflux protein [Halomonadaceae bacterium LMG 33818]|uniref:LysE family translocator n=1 Tax=Cernens ardua TaxID=3402176 RepID=UPI003EDC13F2
MNSTIITAFWFVSILFVITPGLDWAYAISAGVSARKRNVALAVLGMVCGHFFVVTIVAIGVGKIVASHPDALMLLTLLGALYLLWLGLNMLRQPPKLAKEGVVSKRSWFWKGVCMSGINPKVLLLFLALMPQFINEHAFLPVGLQILLLGMIHVVSCAVVYSFVGFSAHLLLASRPATTLWVSRASGIMMSVIALLLIGHQLWG